MDEDKEYEDFFELYGIPDEDEEYDEFDFDELED